MDTPQSRTVFLVIIVPVTVFAVVMVVGHRVVEPVQPGVKRLAQNRARYIVHGRIRSLCFELQPTNEALRIDAVLCFRTVRDEQLCAGRPGVRKFVVDAGRYVTTVDRTKS